MRANRVLVVDDEEELAFATAERLKLRGVEAEACTSAEQALRRVDETPYDVAVVDVKLPGTNGVALMTRMRESRPGLAVILLSGYASEQEREDALQRGAADYVFKPFDIEDLASAIEGLSQLRESVCDDRASAPSTRDCLAFFGKVSASTTHEVKNVLAIISQQAGLIDDLIAISEGVAPVDKDRIRKLAAKIAAQVTAGDELVRRLNRFAHSTEAAADGFELVAALRDVTDAAGRLAALRRSSLEVDLPQGGLTVAGGPFHFHMLVFGCLELFLDPGREADRLAISLRDGGSTAVLELEGAALDESEEVRSNLSRLESLAAFLGARLQAKGSAPGRTVLRVVFPRLDGPRPHPVGLAAPPAGTAQGGDLRGSGG